MKTSSAKKLKALSLSLGLGLVLGLITWETQADDIYVPDIGTAGVLGLTIQKEEQIGEFLIRKARASLPIINDPVMDEYIGSVSNKLLMNADNVNFPFEFFLVNDTSLNASAFLGGKVQINAGLFIHCATEDEFASVLAHEISHVTQRHLARFIEAQSIKNNVTLASLIGSIAMSIINPALGMAAVNTTMGAALQSRINFTRDNEYEADRIGISLLYRAGFNPEGAIDMFRRLLAMQRNLNPAYTMLIDHPLSEVRVAEARNRVARLPSRKNSTNPDFYMAKARVDVRYSQRKPEELLPVMEHTPFVKNAVYQNYALALLNYELGNYTEAREALAKLGGRLSGNVFVIDLLTDLDLKQNQAQNAIRRLQNAYNRTPNSLSIIVNLANSYITSGRYDDAIRLFREYHNKNEPSTLTLELLATAQEKSGDKCSYLQSRGDLLSLKAQYAPAIGSFNEALRLCSNNLVKERIRARVVEISNQRAEDEKISKES